jgi:tripartite-type tricarboxylate transporter receptor subunit TctC
MKENTIALALLSALLVTPAAAQTGDAKAELVKLKPNDFPTAPIEYTVVYPAGGGMDVTARLLAKYVEKWSDHRIIVNNRTGGAGMVGHAYLATQAKPDGYTVGIIANLMWGDAMLRAQGRWTYSDLEPIGYLNSDALTWVGPTEGPYKDMSVKQLVETAKDKPARSASLRFPAACGTTSSNRSKRIPERKFYAYRFRAAGPASMPWPGETSTSPKDSTPSSAASPTPARCGQSAWRLRSA